MKRLFYCIAIGLLLGCGARKAITEHDIQVVTIQIRDTLRDSVFVERTHIERDSVMIYQRGDTVYRDRWRTIYKDAQKGIERERIVIRHDTIRVDREVVKTIQPSRWQRIREALLIAAVVVGLFGAGIFLKRFI